jgi:hypothetical protein
MCREQVKTWINSVQIDIEELLQNKLVLLTNNQEDRKSIIYFLVYDEVNGRSYISFSFSNQ